VASPDGNVNRDNPPANVPGMVNVILDGNGRLLEFDAVPDDTLPSMSNPAPPADVFRAAGLDLATFREIDPRGVPPNAFDQRRMWRGPHPRLPKTELLLDGAWWKGRVTRVRHTYPWMIQGTSGADPTGSFVRTATLGLLQLIGALFVSLMAWHNWRHNRADLRGAFRVAMARLLLAAIAWIGLTHPVEDEAMLANFLGASGDWLLSAAIMWVVYLALEPAVRARWPHSIVTWNRVLTGRWKDAQVGSEILLGAAVGAGMWIAFKLVNYLLSGGGEPTMLDINLHVALGTRQWIGAHAGILGNALRLGLLVFLAVFGLRVMLRKDWIAVLAAAALFTLMENELRTGEAVVLFPIYMVVYGTLIFLLLRFGLVATITTVFFVNGFNNIPLGTSLKTWYTAGALASFSLMLGIAVYAFYRSLGGSELIGDNPT
jgi:serine/threonine-protein kinase